MDDAISKGAKALTGGSTPDLSAPYDKGNFFQPTVLADCSTDMKVSTRSCNALVEWLLSHAHIVCACVGVVQYLKVIMADNLDPTWKLAPQLVLFTQVSKHGSIAGLQ